MKIYLCGPIHHCTDSQAMGWRNRVMRDLEGHHEFVNPMARDYRGRENENEREIVEGDLKDIDGCDTVLALCVTPSWGTAMEIFYAHRAGKRVLCVCSQFEISPWLRFHSSAIYHDIHAAILALTGSKND